MLRAAEKASLKGGDVGRIIYSLTRNLIDKNRKH